MKREIKFRGKRVGSNEWTYGSYVNFQNPDLSRTIGIMTWMGVFFEVHPETIGQYVGEVCGLDLWENDIVKITNLKETWRSEPQFDWRVLRIEYNRFVWSLKNYYLYMPLREMDEDCTYTYEMTLLGNIHDNPELIK